MRVARGVSLKNPSPPLVDLTAQDGLEPVSAPETHEAVGQHLLVTFKNCAADVLNDIDSLRDLTMRAAVATGATVLNICAQKFEPQGVTVVAVLAESHASLHTYPEVQKVFWDCFTCGSACDPAKSIDVLSAGLKTKDIAAQIVERQ